MRITRIVILFAIVVAGYLNVNPPGCVGEVVAHAFGLAAASFFPVILLGIFDHRTNRAGAIAGMISGLGFTAVYILGNTAQKIFPGVEAPWFGPLLFGTSPSASAWSDACSTSRSPASSAASHRRRRITSANSSSASASPPPALRPPEDRFDERGATADDA